MERADGRSGEQMRSLQIDPHFRTAAPGSVLIEFGSTRVLCAATVEEAVPRWMRQQGGPITGWVTGEYSMLPYATSSRTIRESAAGKIGGRTQEIQRLIGRSLRAAVDLPALGDRTVWVDCDVLFADGGTRTAAITGGFVALALAIEELVADGKLERSPLRDQVAAVSVGMVDGAPLLDLCYSEDVAAQVDCNIVKTGSGLFVEIQGTAEGTPFSRGMLDEFLRLADLGLEQLFRLQREAIGGARLWQDRGAGPAGRNIAL